DAAQFFGALGKIHQQDQIERDGCGEDGVAAEKIDLDLHRIAKPAEDVDVIPTFFIITAWRVIVNANLVINVAVQFGVQLRLQDVIQYAELRLFLGLERLRIVEDFPVAITENVGRVPAADAQHARLERRCQDGLDQRLTGLEVLAADGSIVLLRQLLHHGQIDSEVRRAIGKRQTFGQRGIRIYLRGRDAGIVGFEALLKGGDRLVNRG